MALLPPHLFRTCIELMKEEVNNYDEIYHEKLFKYLRYVERYWYPKREIVSVYRLPHRTNNLCESLNSRLKSKLGGKRPRVWKFTSMT